MRMNSATLLIAIPLLVAFTQPIIGMFSKKATKVVTFLTILYNFIFGITIFSKVLKSGPLVAVIGNWKPPFGINLYMDAFSMFIATTIYFVGLLVAFYFIGKEDTEVDAKASLILLLLIAASGGMVLTGDIFNMFVFIEITSISTYAFVAYRKTGKAFKGSIKYMIVGSLSSSLFLLAIAFLYGSIGTLNLAEIALKFHTLNPYMASVIVTLFGTSLLLEAEIFPFNMWLPDVYDGAHSYTGALLSGVVGTAGIYALLRLMATIFSVQGSIFGQLNFNAVLIVLGAMTVTIGELSALSQKNLKRILAYSSMSQMGIVVLALGIASQSALYGGIFHVFNHAIAKSLLFLTAGIIITSLKTTNIDEMEGFGRKNPLIAIIFSIGTFSIIGLPFFSGFWSKMYIIKAAVQGNGWTIFALTFVLASIIIESFYYFRIIYKFFVDKKVETKGKSNFFQYATVLVLAAIILYIGFNPSVLQNILNSALKGLQDKSQYISTVMGLVR